MNRTFCLKRLNSNCCFRSCNFKIFFTFRDELKLGHGKKPGFKSFELVALGTKDNVRAQLPATGLSVEQQVSALIDQVTDPNILGRTWLGWEAWV